jgi:hypothetical protein
MSVNFILPARTRIDEFRDTMSVGDTTKYVIDCTPWQDDNATINSVTWTLISGTATITGNTNTGGVVSANVNATQAGNAIIAVLLHATGGLHKKFWLFLNIKDPTSNGDDYGYTA